MNKDNAKDYLPLVQALADGKVIQIEIDGVWTDGNEFHFVDQPSEYRIKPEPREIFVVIDDDNTGSNIVFDDEALADQCARRRSGQFVRRFREVIDG